VGKTGKMQRGQIGSGTIAFCATFLAFCASEDISTLITLITLIELKEEEGNHEGHEEHEVKTE
jgi:hypothetical protein